MKVSQYPRNADSSSMKLLVGVLTDETGNNGERLKNTPLGPDGNPLEAIGIVLVDMDGNFQETIGALTYKGVWNAATNTPAIPAAAPLNKGEFYKVSVAGTTNIDGINDWGVGDWIISNGTTWDKIDNSELVTSVAGKIGAVTLNKSDVGLSNVDNTSDANKPVSTAQQTALNAKANLDGGNNLTGNQSINQGNQANVHALQLTNVGVGTVGVKLTYNSGGSAYFGGVQSNAVTDYAENRSKCFWVNGGSFDTSAQAFLFTNGMGSTKHGIVIQNAAAGYTGDFFRALDNVGTAKARLASDGKMWLLGVSSPVFDEAANVLGRGLAFDSGGATVTIPANNQWNFIGIRNAGSNINFTINSGGIVSGLSYYVTAANGSHASSNLYAVLGELTNAGPGTTKALYGRASASATCTGVVMGGVFRIQLDAGSNASASYPLQVGHAGDPTKALSGIMLIDTEAASGQAGYGILSANSMSYTTAFIRACAGGGGKFLQWQASGGGADLFNVLDTGAIFTNASLTVGTGATVLTDGELTRSVSGGNLIVTSGDTGTLFLGYGATRPLQISAAGGVNFTSALRFNGTQIVSSRRTGWAAPTGTATRTTFDTTTVTLSQLAERVKALLDDLTIHGLIGA